MEISPKNGLGASLILIIFKMKDLQQKKWKKKSHVCRLPNDLHGPLEFLSLPVYAVGWDI